MVECPRCNERMRDTEEVDLEIDGGLIIRGMIGYCMHCRKSYKWDEVYSFAGIEEMEEVEND